jgi:hypothetical protein
MTHHAPLVWIEVGRKLPPHLIANMRLHQELLPSCQQVLLTDQTPTKRAISTLKSLGVSVIKIDSPNDYFSKKIRRSTSQLEFWINTTYRFIVLEDFMRSKKVSQVIHQESDNVILERDPLDQLFETPGWGLAYPLQAKEIGCASIFLVKELTSLIKFNTFVKNSWEKVDQDDMKLLGEFSARKDVKILPSIPEFDYIFDAQTYGRYLLGTDARNNRNPFSRRGISDSREGSIDPGHERITFELSKERTTLLVFRNSKVSKLVNIHIHSKRIPASRAALNRMISHDIKSMGTRTWVIGRIDLRVFSERLISWILRRILRKDRDIRLR